MVHIVPEVLNQWYNKSVNTRTVLMSTAVSGKALWAVVKSSCHEATSQSRGFEHDTYHTKLLTVNYHTRMTLWWYDSSTQVTL